MAERSTAQEKLASLSRVKGVRRATRGEAGRSGDLPARWELPELSGRVCELSGLGAAAQLSLAFTLVEEAQRGGEPVAWITDRASTFFPPDAAASGVDLEALPVVFVPDAPAAARAADRLARSGAFGLVVLDLVGTRAEVPPALQSRLAGLAQRHGTAVLYLTEKSAEGASVGPLVSLRCQADREGREGGRLTCRVRVVKDKRRGPGWTHAELRHGPAGLR
jgi:recombination protein RecA